MKSLALAIALVPFAALAQDADPVVDTLTAHTFPLRIERGALAGPGADFLRNEIKQSQFTLIGEDHGTRELPELGAAMFAVASAAGYRHLAIEAGPLSGETLERLARSGGAKEIESFDRKYRFALPFFQWAEEADYLARAVAAAGGATKRVVWGVDQEFVFALDAHLDRLNALAKTDAQRDAVAALARRSREATAAVTNEHKPMAALMLNLTPADFDRLNVFAVNGEAMRIVGELRESAAIYQQWATGQNLVSNEQRVALMKRHFTTYYREAVAAGEAMPRVMMKFGSEHMWRGLSPNNTYELGAMLPELATFNGSRSFHLLVIGRGGKVNALQPYSRDAADRARTYSPDYDPADPDLAPLFSAAIRDAWSIVDLRPIRPLIGARAGAAHPNLKRLAFGYDAVLVIPEFHPATTVE